MINSIRSILSILLLFVIICLSFQIINKSKFRQVVVIENAELKNIKYGLLSVHSWKREISNIIAKKVKEFELTTENRRELRVSIQSGMFELLNEVDRILAANRTQGNFVERAISSIVQSMVFNINDLRRRVPQFTEIILNELDNYETREKMRKFIQKKIDELLHETIGEEDLTKIHLISQKYNCDNPSKCLGVLELKLTTANKELKIYSYSLVLISIIIFLIIILKNKSITVLEYYLLILLCGILLYVGISTPMIDIDARIDDFKFLLMGEPLEFSDQILFFQSKSIFEVVHILISTGDYQAELVGGLILIFSVIFPISKLIASILIIQSESYSQNKIIYFLALKSGKWSMADVLVVAIFMAYIGFQGVIENQLKQLENISDNIEILTTDNSNLGVGFIIFLSFCILSLFLSTNIENKIKGSS